ncbi:hypothetical protein AVEN_243633-1 [Araneus ventricosus]|uniref:Uncharacterized protein n=1 Tax=Araneus ventricosus TaxID=182803 RepID=A0A4Y2A5R3_ARAVE|nr:hypothetical protein AVEN_243633-1 [Araneus ventricosus]
MGRGGGHSTLGVGAGELSEGDENWAISFIYVYEDFYTEIREKVIQSITTRSGLLKDFLILKASVFYKEYGIYYGFMVSSTDLHAVFKTEKSSG